MSLKPLKTIRSELGVRLEYSVVDGYPQSFPSLASDDRCTWENLRLLCEVGHTTDNDCVDIAWALLKREVETPTQEELDLEAANALLEPEPEV